MMVGKWIRRSGDYDYHKITSSYGFKSVNFATTRCLLNGGSITIMSHDHVTDSPPDDQKCKKCASAQIKE